MPAIKLALLIPILIIGFAHGASSQIVSNQTINSSCWKHIEDNLKCLPEIVTFPLKIALLKINDQDEKSLLKGVEEACAPFQNCIKNTECLSDSFQAFKNLCDSFSYVLSPKFERCMQCVNHSDFNCTKKHPCDLFGTNDCQKDLVIRHCEHNAWRAHKTVVLFMNTIFHEPSDSCDNDHFFNL